MRLALKVCGPESLRPVSPQRLTDLRSQVDDTIIMNIVLDRKTVPQSALDFVVYHEMLHKHLGVKWKSTRIAAHTDEFAAWERQFHQYDEAQVALRKLVFEG